MRGTQVNKIIAAATLMVVLAALGGCGGGGSGSVAGGGVGGSGVTVASVGTVTGFGSVIVNGVAYATGDAEIFVENEPKGTGDAALAQNISTGMVVRVEGVLNTDGSAAARRVFFNSDLKGPVESPADLDSFTKQIVILGQTVVLDGFSVFRNTTIDEVTAGMVLEISGYLDESGRFQATYVTKVADALSPESAIEIKGLVQDIDAQAQTYTVNALMVDFSSADVSGLPGGRPQAGQLLKARGKWQGSDRLVADRLELEEEFGSDEFETAEFEGIITRTGGSGQFAIGRYTVLTDETTVYRNMDPQDLNRGARVIVRGALSDRAILADEIGLSEAVRIESDAGTVDPAGNRLTLAGLQAIDIQATATTRIIGTAAGLDEIEPGDHVRMLGRRSSYGLIVASSLQITPSSRKVELTGPVDSAAPPELVVLGVAVDTDPIPAERFNGVGGKPVSPAEFFGMVKPGDIVSVKGIQETGDIAWSDIQIE